MNTALTTGQPGKAKWNLPEPPKRRLREQFADWLRTRNYRPATIAAYVSNVLDYVLFHGKRDPHEMGAREVQEFLTMLAVKWNVSWKTQNDNSSDSSEPFAATHG
jgi:hypothetical protein